VVNWLREVMKKKSFFTAVSPPGLVPLSGVRGTDFDTYVGILTNDTESGHAATT
jgi:hypothetical protein